MNWEALQVQASQDGQFGQVENSISISLKDDDLITIFLLQALSPTSDAFSTQQGATQAGMSPQLFVGATCWACHRRKAIQSPMTSRVKRQCTNTTASLFLRKRRKCQ